MYALKCLAWTRYNQTIFMIVNFSSVMCLFPCIFIFAKNTEFQMFTVKTFLRSENFIKLGFKFCVNLCAPMCIGLKSAHG